MFAQPLTDMVEERALSEVFVSDAHPISLGNLRRQHLMGAIKRKPFALHV